MHSPTSNPLPIVQWSRSYADLCRRIVDQSVACPTSHIYLQSTDADGRLTTHFVSPAAFADQLNRLGAAGVRRIDYLVGADTIPLFEPRRGKSRR